MGAMPTALRGHVVPRSTLCFTCPLRAVGMAPDARKTEVNFRRAFIASVIFGAWLSLAAIAAAHPLSENAMDVVVAKDRITIEVRIASEEIVLVESAVGRTSTDAEWKAAVERHAQYVAGHLHVRVDGQELAGSAAFVAMASGNVADADDPAQWPMVPYRCTYSLSAAPRTVAIGQDFLKEFARWHATFAVRSRREDQNEFALSLLQRDIPATIQCDWPAKSAGAATSPTAIAAAADSVRTDVEVWPMFRAYALHGIEHILTGYDHLLFVTALVLAATSFWDLVKVVTAFTIAHTITLALSVFNIVVLRSSIVEPMIAASIVFVAVQNIFWPEHSSGGLRLAVAFGFGLFHGLGFAGGLRDAMIGMPSVALWAALVAFSLGVEIGHQIVVIPLYSLLWGTKNLCTDRPRVGLQNQILRFGSIGIAIAGVYFLVAAVS